MKVMDEIPHKLLFFLAILLFFSQSSKAQYLTKEKIAFYSSTLFYCAMESITEAYAIKEKHETDPNLRTKYMQTWHRTKIFREMGSISTGITIALDSDFKPLHMLSNLFVSASMFWLIHDEVINRINGWDNIPFGYTSQSSGVWSGSNGSFFDKFANPYIKISSLLLSVFLNMLVSQL